MRFVFSVRPFIGHLHPMLPLASTLVRAGHEVVFATADTFSRVVASAGFVCATAGNDPTLGTPDTVPADARGAYGLWTTRQKTSDLLRLCRDWRPDVIVREPTDFAGLLAAEVLRLPHATLGFSQFYSLATWRKEVGFTLDRLRAEYGLPPDPHLQRLYPYLYLDVVPPWFQPSGRSLPAALVAIRPGCPDLTDDATHLESIFGGAPRRPLVYCTLGTVYNKHRRFFAVVAEALAEEQVSVLCTVGPDQAPDDVLAAPPANVRLAQYVPQSSLLASCDLVVSHGGFNTVIGALCAGVPMVNVPHGSDHHGNSTRTRQLGAGVVLRLDRLEPHNVRDAVLHVLGEPGFGAAARAFREAVATLPTVEHGARLVAELPDLLSREVDLRSYSAGLLRVAGTPS